MVLPAKTAASLVRFVRSPDVVKALLSDPQVVENLSFDAKLTAELSVDEIVALATRNPRLGATFVRNSEDPVLLARLAELDGHTRLEVLASNHCPAEVANTWHDWLLDGADNLRYKVQGVDPRNLAHRVAFRADLRISLDYLAGMEPKWRAHRYPVSSLANELARRLFDGDPGPMIELIGLLEGRDLLDPVRHTGSRLARHLDDIVLDPQRAQRLVAALRAVESVSTMAYGAIVTAMTGSLAVLDEARAALLLDLAMSEESLERHRDALSRSGYGYGRTAPHLALGDIRNSTNGGVAMLMSSAPYAPAVLCSALAYRKDAELVSMFLASDDPAALLQVLFHAPEYVPSHLANHVVARGLTKDALERRRTYTQHSYASTNALGLLDCDVELSTASVIALLDSPERVTEFLSGRYARKPVGDEAIEVFDALVFAHGEVPNPPYLRERVLSITSANVDSPWIDKFLDWIGPQALQWLLEEHFPKYLARRLEREFGDDTVVWNDALQLMARSKVNLTKTLRSVRSFAADL